MVARWSLARLVRLAVKSGGHELWRPGAAQSCEVGGSEKEECDSSVAKERVCIYSAKDAGEKGKFSVFLREAIMTQWVSNKSKCL